MLQTNETDTEEPCYHENIEQHNEVETENLRTEVSDTTESSVNDTEPSVNDTELSVNDTESSVDLDCDDDRGEANNIDHEIIALIALLKSQRSVPFTTSSKIIEQTSEIVKSVVETLKRRTEHKLKEMLKRSGNPEAENIVEEILTIFENVNPFENYMTDWKQLNYLKSQEAIVLPQEKELGMTMHPGTSKHDGVGVQLLQTDTYQYVPLPKLLKSILEQPGVMKGILDQSPSEDGVMTTYSDGELVTQKGSENYPVISLLLYSDDFETANPLGSKKSIHKLCAFYINILNQPRCIQASLSNIHLLALCKSRFISKYGMDSVLYPIIEDFKSLDINGLKINCHDYCGIVKPKLFQVIGDNLGVHTMLGFSGSFSANFYCRFCKVHRIRAQTLLQEDEKLLRNKINYADDLAQNNMSATGIGRNSIFNELNYYHVTENISVDIMHDIFEGIAPLEVKLVLQHFIGRGYFTLDELNNRVASFNYGFAEKKNRPSAISANSLANAKGPSGQSASQMMCLAFNLPLIIGDKVEEDNEFWELLLMLLDIIKVVLSRSNFVEETYQLSALIRDHHGLFLRLFPDTCLIPKHHFLLHYPRSMRYLGPLQQYSSMRFEAKHKQLKQHANVSSNFQNIAKTVANKHQIAQGFNKLLRPQEYQNIELFGPSNFDLSSLEDEEVLQRIPGVADNSVVSVTHMYSYGYEFRAGTVVITGVVDDLPKFSQIVQIFVVQDKIFFLVGSWETQYFFRHYHSYAVLPTEKTQNTIIQFDNVKYQRTLHITQCNNSEDGMFYVATRSMDLLN